MKWNRFDFLSFLLIINLKFGPKMKKEIIK